MKSRLLLFAVGLSSLAFNKADAQVTKNCLIEEFSSSTCGPCASMNAWFDPLLIGANANKEKSGLVVLKYQMYFPSPGTDASYNAHGKTRAQTYIAGMSSWGIPLHFTNGKWHDTAVGGGTSSAIVTNELNNCKGGTAQLDITGTYTVRSISSTSDSVWITVTVTPKANLTGNYKLFIAASEDHYQNTSAATGHTTSQVDFYYVMRKMFPDGNGISISTFKADTPQTFTFKDAVKIGSNTQLDYNWWGNPYNGALVAFVSDMSKPVRAQANVLQAQAIRARWATNVPEVANFKNINVGPNPASDFAGVFFNLAEPADITMTVMDVTGRVVYSQPAQHFGTDAEKIIIPTSNLANGTYMIYLSSVKGTMTQRLVVEK